MVHFALMVGLVASGLQETTEWEAETGGRSHSVPVLHDDRILISAVSSKESRRLLYCLDATTGKEAWSVEHGDDGLRPPLCDGGRVFQCSGLGGVIAIDLESGKSAWRNTRIKYPARGLFSFRKDRLFTADGRFLFGIDARTGDELWRMRSERHEVAPVFRGDAGFLVRRPDDARRSWMLTAVNLGSWGTLWEVECESRDSPSFLATDDRRLYVVTASDVSALDLTSGRCLWKADVGGIWSAPVVTPNPTALLVGTAEAQRRREDRSRSPGDARETNLGSARRAFAAQARIQDRAAGSPARGGSRRRPFERRSPGSPKAAFRGLFLSAPWRLCGKS